MRKSNIINIKHVLRYIAVAFVIAALALVSIPFGGLISHAEAPAAKEEMTAPSRKAGGASVEVTVKYFRPNGDYTDWNVWLWSAGGDGTAHDFTGETTVPITGTRKWKTLTATVSGVDLTNAEAIGFIVRLGAWVEKDVGTDRFIAASHITDNKATIYVVSGDAEFYYDEESIVFGAKIITAKFTSFSTVSVRTAAPVTNTSVFVIKDEDNNTYGTINGANPAVLSRTSFSIEFVGDLDLSKSYSVHDEPLIEFDPEKHFIKHAITIADLYNLKPFKDEYDYSGKLGAEYTPAGTTFRVWSPAAKTMAVKIYEHGHKDEGAETVTPVPMTMTSKGVYEVTVDGDLDGKYYTYLVNGAKEIVDPYAESAGKNGTRGMIIKPGSADPEGWATHSRPGKRKSNSDAIIYEAQLRDLTIHESSNVPAEKRGKYLGMTVKSEDVGGKMTPLSYLKDLGITEVHFQPMFDFNSVDESFAVAEFNSGNKANTQYNWGYDPLNYNAPEGSYSSDPNNGKVRVNELKQMIMALHESGIRVILDVVYNHVANASGSNFEALMPGYYFRTNANGDFTNGSGCGNETASDRYMFHKFMIDSCMHWAEEYKVDGFRFDLMGLHDTDTMNAIYDNLQTIDADHDIMVYGEPWDAGSNAMPGHLYTATLANARKMPNIAVFNDITRDALKGSVWEANGTGFVSGKGSTDNAIYIGAAGGTAVNGVYYDQFNKKPFAVSPTQNINYASCHDNETLWDRLNASVNADKETLKAMNRLSATAVLTGQGAAFFLAGEELLRSKKADPTANSTYGYDGGVQKYMTDPTYYYSRNSYKSPDSVNAIDWTLAETNKDMVDYYKGLIAVRKLIPELHVSNKAALSKGLTIRDNAISDGVTSYTMKDPDSKNSTVVLFNNNADSRAVLVPDGKYTVYVDGASVSAEGLKEFSGNTYTVGPRSAVVMRGEIDAKAVKTWAATKDGVAEESSNLGLALGLGIGLPALALIAGGALFFLNRKKKGTAAAADKVPAGAAPVQPDKPAEDASAEEQPAEETPVEEAPAEDAPAEDAPAEE